MVQVKWNAIRSTVPQILRRLAPLRAPDLPANPLHDDLYLVEFPKSGITWLCYLMANVNLQLSGDHRQRVTFYNLTAFIPEVNTTPFLNAPILSLPSFRMIKSHAFFNPHYFRVIYLVRDPRDVMVSYHTFLNQTGWFRGSLEQVIGHKEFGIAAWCRHVLGWLNNVPPSHSFALLRYEDLLADTAGELKTLYRLLGFDLDDELVSKAIARSSIERMRADEAEANARHPANANLEFVRKGNVGGPRETLPDPLRRRIEEMAGPLLDRLRYPL